MEPASARNPPGTVRLEWKGSIPTSKSDRWGFCQRVSARIGNAAVPLWPMEVTLADSPPATGLFVVLDPPHWDRATDAHRFDDYDRITVRMYPPLTCRLVGERGPPAIPYPTCGT